MQMQVADLKNLVVLARKGMEVLSAGIPGEQAAAGWQAIANAEGFVAHFEQQYAAQAQAQENNVTEGNEDGTTSELHVVNLDEDGNVAEDEAPEPVVEDDES